MIDTTKTLYTNNGHRVTNLSYVPYNSSGNAVTFPIKGTIVIREKPLKTRYEIWTKSGQIHAGANESSNWDLVIR